MILLTLASKQIWPQVLAVAHLKPSQVFLLHTSDFGESEGPAERLKTLFDTARLVPRGGTKLESIPHDDFAGIAGHLDALTSKHKLNLAECRLNFTGGNKLMATAAFRWASRRGVQAFYLERGNIITWFEPGEGEARTRLERLDGHASDHLDPLDLLRCQLDASEVERGGEILALNQLGLTTPRAEIERLLLNGANPLEFLVQARKVNARAADGDRLEFISAIHLLKAGVNGIRRSVRLKVKPRQGTQVPLPPHAELDLLFNHGGRLWLVDCKDRKPAEDLVRGLWPFILPKERASGSEAGRLIARIADDLAISQAKVLKEDLVAIREIGGLLGRTVCVRRKPLPPEVEEYARLNGIALVYKDSLGSSLAALLGSGGQAPIPRPAA